jgi:metallophosphoesterase (TIGR00282 family)
LRVLFVADVFARAGREALEQQLPGLREELELDLVVANGENAAQGAGINGRLADRMLAAGVDCITLGNHTWRQRDVAAYLIKEPRIIRPANYLETAPGRGWTVVEARDGTPVAVINLLGQLYLQPARSPFEIAEALVAEASHQARVVLVDMHAEATSEKVAMGRLLAGKVTAVLGTHTHVQTNDAAVWDGTAYLTDCGMTGPHDSIIGVKTEVILRRFLTQLPQRFEPAEGGVRIEGALVECDPSTGRATGIQPFRRGG